MSTNISLQVKFNPILKATVIFLIISFHLAHTAKGQVIIEKSEASKDKKTITPECDLKYEGEYIFTIVEIEATHNVHTQSWYQYAQKYFDFHSVVQNLSDTVKVFHDSLVVKFIVTKNGKICNIETLNGNEILVPAVTKLLKSSQPWAPAQNGGRQLNSYRTLKIEVLIDKNKNEFKIGRNYKSYNNPEG